jgi:MarR family transcriptional regulator, organic hydroperoxide resistance regulator
VSVQAPPRTEVLETVGRAFKGAMAALRRLRGRETHQPGELTFAQYGLLFGLSDGSAKSSRDLALLADISPATAAEMLDLLAAAGLVDRTRSDEDKRIVLTSLTDRGRELIEERRRRHEPRWSAAMSEFTDEELLTAARVLDAIRGVFDEGPSDEGPSDGTG